METIDDENQKLCEEVIKLIARIMPSLIIVPSQKLDKIVEQIVGRAINQPEASAQYAKICSEIHAELTGEDSQRKFRSSVISAAQKSFVEFLTKKNQPLNVPLGTIRFLGELYKVRIFTKRIMEFVHGRLKELAYSSASPLEVDYFRYLYELIIITGYPFEDDLLRFACLLL